MESGDRGWTLTVEFHSRRRPEEAGRHLFPRELPFPVSPFEHILVRLENLTQGGALSDIHITRELLRAVARGDLPPQTLVEYGYKHLVGLCGICREEFAAFRREQTVRSDVNASFQALSAILNRHERDFKDVGKEVQRDLKELLSLPHERRLARIGRSVNRFRGALLASLLLDESRKAMPGDLETVQELAETAEAVLRRTPAGPGVADLASRSSAYLGNVSRMRGDVQEAQRRFYYARYLIKYEGVAEPRIYAEVDWLEGSLQLDQRHFAEAEELLTRSITLYTIAGDREKAGQPLLTLGLVHYHRGNYAKAIEATQEATYLLSEEADPRIYLSARHNLTLYHCEAGNYHAASDALHQDRDLYARFPDAWTQLRLVWLEGKIAHGLGNLEAAEKAFLATRSGFVEEGAGYDAAMVSIDLATIYTQQGRADEALRIAEEMHVVFKAEDVHREAVAALLLFQEAARQKSLTVEKLRDLSEYLKAARGNPSLRFRK
jgi:tetratricopeptide (TPR) repeat protein